MLEIALPTWLSRVESQLSRAVAMALDRPREAGRLPQEPRRTDGLVPAVAAALGDPGAVVDLPAAISRRRQG